MVIGGQGLPIVGNTKGEGPGRTLTAGTGRFQLYEAPKQATCSQSFCPEPPLKKTKQFVCQDAKKRGYGGRSEGAQLRRRNARVAEGASWDLVTSNRGNVGCLDLILARMAVFCQHPTLRAVLESFELLG